METIAHETSSSTIEYPSLSERIQSTFIDTIFIVMLMFFFSSVLERYENVPDFVRIILFFALWAVYEPVCTSLGFTLGNYIKGIRVRRMRNPGRKLHILLALVRYVLKIALGWASFLSMHLNPQKRAIHDLVAGSVMIKKSSE